MLILVLCLDMKTSEGMSVESDGECGGGRVESRLFRRRIEVGHPRQRHQEFHRHKSFRFRLAKFLHSSKILCFFRLPNSDYLAGNFEFKNFGAKLGNSNFWWEIWNFYFLAGNFESLNFWREIWNFEILAPNLKFLKFWREIGIWNG